MYVTIGKGLMPYMRYWHFDHQARLVESIDPENEKKVQTDHKSNRTAEINSNVANADMNFIENPLD